MEVVENGKYSTLAAVKSSKVMLLCVINDSILIYHRLNWVYTKMKLKLDIYKEKYNILGLEPNTYKNNKTMVHVSLSTLENFYCNPAFLKGCWV